MVVCPFLAQSCPSGGFSWYLDRFPPAPGYQWVNKAASDSAGSCRTWRGAFQRTLSRLWFCLVTGLPWSLIRTKRVHCIARHCLWERVLTARSSAVVSTNPGNVHRIRDWGTTWSSVQFDTNLKFIHAQAWYNDDLDSELEISWHVWTGCYGNTNLFPGYCSLVPEIHLQALDQPYPESWAILKCNNLKYCHGTS